MSLRDKYTNEEWNALEESVEIEKVLTIKITEKDIKLLIRDKILALEDKVVNPANIKFDVVEKVVSTYQINNFENEDIMGFDYIKSIVKIKN